MKLIIPALILLIGAVTVSGIVHAKSHDPDKIVEKVTKKLSLDNQQQQALRDFVTAKFELREQLKKEREQSKQQRESGEFKSPFAQLKEKDTITVDEITSVIDAKMVERRERRLPLLEKFVAFRNSLSKEQSEQGEKVMKRLLRGVLDKHDRHGRHPHA